MIRMAFLINDIQLFYQSIIQRKTAMDNLQHLSLNSHTDIYDGANEMNMYLDTIGQSDSKV